jgi:hypothetical protein
VAVADAHGLVTPEVGAAFGAIRRTGWEADEVEPAPPAQWMIINLPPAHGKAYECHAGRERR